jgi:hypothetical protein
MSQIDQAALTLLLDERDIRKLYLRYARAVDRLDSELLRGCFHKDAVITTSSEQVRDDFVKFVIPALSHFKMTQHVTTNIWVEVEGNSARGDAYAQANHRAPGENGGVDTDYRWGGRYVDQFEKRNGEWRFLSRVVMHDMDRVVKVNETWQPPGLGYTQGIHSTDDLVYQNKQNASQPSSD